MKRTLLPIGISDFRKLVTHTDEQGNRLLFLDKSLLIPEVIADSSEVTLLTRPRRFGKTLKPLDVTVFLCQESEWRAYRRLIYRLESSRSA